MKIVGRSVLVVAVLGVTVGVVFAIPGIITRARWYGFTQRTTRFMTAVDRRDTTALLGQTTNATLVHQVLGLRDRRPALVRAATSSLTLEEGQREGDTVLVAIRTTHSSCDPAGEMDRLRLAFVMLEGEYRVAWLRTTLCGAGP